MSYIGKAPGFGIRNRYYYTATASQTTFSGADDNGQTLAYADSKYLDVYLNGVSLVAGTDYTATTLTSVILTTGAAASDIVEIVAYDIFSIPDAVSSANGGVFSGAVTFDTTDAVTLPVGTEAQRPTAVKGMFRFNDDLDAFEGYNGTEWGSVGGGATGGGTDAIFYENGQTVTTNYTITTNNNAMSAGPITIDSGVTVTVPSGSTWTVV